MSPRRRSWLPGVGWAAFVLGAGPLAAQSGLQVSGIPAINFDADEGFGYGVVLALHKYGDGGSEPYRWTLQPTVFLTTEGRREFTIFFDAPSVRGRWRLTANVGSERLIAAPYYGLGNDSEYDAERVDDQNPWYYRFGRSRHTLAMTLQRPLGTTPLRVLIGTGFARGAVRPVPHNEGVTVFEADLAAGLLRGGEAWANHLRAGLVWDTRDRETGTRSGVWSDVVVHHVAEWLGSDVTYTRWSATDRRYGAIGPFVVAHRILLQGTHGDLPAFDLHRVVSSYRDHEALGGAKSVRGLLGNRHAGNGLLIWNAELRWRVVEFEALGRSAHVVLSLFRDAGRVWVERPRFGELFRDLKAGYGGGVRLGAGEEFVIAADAGTSAETGLQLYIGLGYIY